MSIKEEIEVNVSEVLDYTKLNGSFALALKEVVKRKIAVDEAKKRGLAVSDEELQNAADIFRTINGLTTVNDTEEWLLERGLNLDALENYLESNLLIYQLKNQLVNEFDREKYLSSNPVQESIREKAYQEWLAKMTD